MGNYQGGLAAMSASLLPFLCLRVCSEESDVLWLSESRHTLAVAGTPLHYCAVIVLNRERDDLNNASVIHCPIVSCGKMTKNYCARRGSPRPLLAQRFLVNLWQHHDIQWFTDARVKLGRSGGYR